jgi:hypothetical protein
MNAQEYYASESSFSNPGKFGFLFDNLPHEIEALCEIIHGIYLHHESGRLVNYAIPQERLQEMDLRYIEAILEQIMHLDNRPLSQMRPPEKRFIGCCRDSALLLCAMTPSGDSGARSGRVCRLLPLQWQKLLYRTCNHRVLECSDRPMGFGRS